GGANDIAEEEDAHADSHRRIGTNTVRNQDSESGGSQSSSRPQSVRRRHSEKIARFLSHSVRGDGLSVIGRVNHDLQEPPMKSLRMLVLFVLGGFALLTPTPTIKADEVIVFSGSTYAAIAYSPATGNYGYAYNHGSRAAAETAAIRYCKADDARIVTWVNNGFCALALGDDQEAWGVGWSYGDGATNTYAKTRALQEARKRTTNAKIILCVCSENVKPEVYGR